VNVSSDSGVAEPLNFGNFQLGAGGGHTIGYWRNNNGMAFLASNNATNSTSEVQKVTVSATGAGGYFRLTFNGQMTPNIGFGASAATVATRLNALSTIGGVGGSVSVVRTGLGTAINPYCYTVTFNGGLKGANVGQMSASVSGTPLPTASVMTQTNGSFGANNWRTILNGLNLRTAAGGNFDLSNYLSFSQAFAAWSSWLASANSTNMAYMLSAQLAAMRLNVLAGFVQGGALLYAPELAPFIGSYPTMGLDEDSYFITVNSLMTLANNELGMDDGYTPSGDLRRPYQNALKTVLDRANNNLNFVIIP
jgi:hypothetical protein